MYFARGLQSLNLNDMQRMPAIAALSQANDPQCPMKLKELSIKLLTPSFKVDRRDEVLLQDQDWGSKVLSDYETYVMKGKPRNRPGLEQAAVKITNQNANPPNQGKGKGPRPQCFRCRSYDHMARECHLPFQRFPAFGGKQKGSAGKGKRPIMMAEQVIDTEEHTQWPAQDEPIVTERNHEEEENPERYPSNG